MDLKNTENATYMLLWLENGREKVLFKCILVVVIHIAVRDIHIVILNREKDRTILLFHHILPFSNIKSFFNQAIGVRQIILEGLVLV